MSLPFVVWLLLGTIWGSTWLFIKVGLQDLPPLTFAGMRFIIALLPLYAFLLWRKPKQPHSRRDWHLILFTGFLTFSLNYGLVFWGENHISSGLTAILYTTLPLFGLLLAHFMLPNEPLSLPKLTGVLTGISGVILIFSNQIRLTDQMAIWGATAILVASLVTAFAGILIKKYGSHIDPLIMTVGQMSFGLVPLLMAGFWLDGNPFHYHWTPRAWLALLYLALMGSSLTFVLLYWLMQNMEVTKTQLMPLLSTLIAVLLGKLVFHEELNWRIVAGGCGILSGLLLTNYGYRKDKKLN